MTDEQLLKNIRSVVSEEIKKETNLLKKDLLTIREEQQSLVSQLEVLDTKQLYFEQTQRSLMEGQRILEQNIKSLQRGQKSLEQNIISLQEGQQVIEKNITSLQQGQKSLEQNIVSLQNGQQTLEKNTASLQKEQKRQGKKLDFIAKTVDIIGRRYDERIVENQREIEKIKDHLGFSVS